MVHRACQECLLDLLLADADDLHILRRHLGHDLEVIAQHAVGDRALGQGGDLGRAVHLLAEAAETFGRRLWDLGQDAGQGAPADQSDLFDDVGSQHLDVDPA
jgi:hypothetical protein